MTRSVQIVVNMLPATMILIVLLCGVAGVQPAHGNHKHHRNGDRSTAAAFRAMSSFGDSLTDTGNALIASNSTDFLSGNYPYGITYFRRPTGRFSDGRLVVDLIAQRLGLPLTVPFLSIASTSGAPLIDPYNSDWSSSYKFVNFAVAGAPALNVSYLQSEYNLNSVTPFSLDTQIRQWLPSYLRIRAVALERQYDFLSYQDLIFFGEIGGNDINYGLGMFVRQPLSSGANQSTIAAGIEIVRRIIVEAVSQAKYALETLIYKGATYILVQSDMLMGCTPIYRRTFINFPKDKYGCIIFVNDLSKLHNNLTKRMVQQLQKTYPKVQFVYLYFDKAYKEVLRNPTKYGIENTTDPCYDITFVFIRGAQVNQTELQGVKPCPNPYDYINWDGIHLTEGMHQAVVSLFLQKGYSKPYPNFLVERINYRSL